MLLISVVLFASYHGAVGIRKNLRMSISLPMQYLNHPEVMKIVNRYKRVNKIFFLISMITTLPIHFIKYTSLHLLYLAIWIGLIFIISNWLYCNYNNKLIMIKSRNLWFVQEYEYRILSSDNVQRKRNALMRKCFPTAVDRLLAKTTEPIYVDEDEYWINGYYYNPNDRKTSVEKRVGEGFTANLATKSGRLSAYGALIFALLILGSIFVMFARMDFATFQMIISDTTVEMKAPLYPYEFEISDIEEVVLSDDLPERASRTNGAGTETYYLGNFIIDGYGSSKVYVYRKCPPYLIIKTKDKTVFFNSKSAEETNQYYKQLKGMVTIVE